MSLRRASANTCMTIMTFKSRRTSGYYDIAGQIQNSGFAEKSKGSTYRTSRGTYQTISGRLLQPGQVEKPYIIFTCWIRWWRLGWPRPALVQFGIDGLRCVDSRNGRQTSTSVNWVVPLMQRTASNITQDALACTNLERVFSECLWTASACTHSSCAIPGYRRGNI